MDKIRLGNDIEMRWSIFTRDGDNKVPYNLEGRALTLSVVNRTGESEIEFFAEGNIVTGVFRGRDQKIIGKHGVILRENNGKDGMRTIDACDAFELVACTCEEALGSPGTIQLFHLTFDSTIGAITGTIDPILNYEAEQAEAERKANEIIRKANEGQRIDNEKQRNVNEILRNTAEEERENAEQERIVNEDLRKADEAERKTNEESRLQSESDRVSSEEERLYAESIRVANENARIASEAKRAEAETARIEAEDKRIVSEKNRLSAESSRIANEDSRRANEDSRLSAEAKRVSAEAKRVSAESERVSAESERVSAESKRVSAESKRVSNEKERQIAEEERQAKFASMVVQTTGDATDKVMSQKAVTEALKGKQSALTDTDGGYGQRVAELEKGKANLQHHHTVADITDFPELYYDATAFFASGAYPSDRYEELLQAVKAKKTVYATIDEAGYVSYILFVSSANSDGSSSRVLLTTIFADGSNLYTNTFVLQKSGMTSLQENITGKADKAKTLAGYGIADAYTKSEVNALLNGKQDTLTPGNGISIEGNVISTAADEEDITTNTEGKLQFKDRSYGDGMGYVILRKNKTFAEQVTNEGTIYEIRDNFTLYSDFSMPSGCALFFNGGKIMGAALRGNNTILRGNVMIENPEGSFDSFRLSWCVASGYTKLKSVLSLDVHEVVFDEDITITSFSGTIPTNIPVINGGNHKITINTDCVVSNESAIFIQCGATTIVKDISIDFTNHNVACGIYSDARSDFSISGVKVENIKSSLINSNWGISGVYVKAYSSINVNIHNIIVKEIGALGNGIPNDSTGPVIGVSVLNVGLNSVINISDIIISHIYNYDSGGTEIVDDASGIYVSNLSISTNDSQINMTNIHAENYGKRCIKLDARYAVIDGLYANQFNIAADGVVGFNSGNFSTSISGNVSLKNARSYGDAGFLVATSIDKTNLENSFFGNTSTVRSKTMLRFMDSSIGQVAHISNCTCENSMFVYSDSVGRSKVYVNEITIHSNTGSIGYLAGLKNTEVYINGYTFDGTVRTVINYLNDLVGSRLHISGARIVCNQGYNAIFNASSPIDFKLTDFVISGYFQGILELSSCLYAEISNGFVEYLGNEKNLVTGIGTIKLSQGTAVVRNVTKNLASDVSYLYGSRISYTGDGTLDIFIDESAAPFNTETKGKVYTKEAFVEVYNRDMTIPASVTGAKMKINNPYTDVPICAEYAGGWRISNAVAVNTPEDANNQVTGYAVGSLLYCKSVAKMILFNGTSWINVDGSTLS